jgi:mercuric ion binding protein
MNKDFNMRHFLAALAFAGMSLSATGAIAGERTIKLAVEGLGCPSCYFIVERSIARVRGVKSVDLSVETNIATVTFDDAMASAQAISNATDANGFPSTIIEHAS